MSPHWQAKSDIEDIVGFMNRCLCVFYKAVGSIESAPDSSRALEMRRAMDEIASEGWSLATGPDDFNEALEHLDTGPAVWSDEAEERYSGSDSKIFPRSVTAPKAFVNFADALDEQFADLADDLTSHMQAANAANRNAQAEHWNEVKGNLTQISNIGNRVSSHLWLLDAVALGRSPQTQQFLAATSRYVAVGTGAVGRFTDIMGRIDAVATINIEMSDAMRGTAGGEQFTNAITAIRAVVDFLPVLGDFYGAALDVVPALATRMRAISDEYHSRAQRAFRGLDPSRTASRPPVCQKCRVAVANPCFGPI